MLEVPAIETLFCSKHQDNAVSLLYDNPDDTVIESERGSAVRNFMTLADALNFIDAHLCDPISQEDIANACYCSLSSLQKLFRYAFHFSIKEYVEKRRLTCAARDVTGGEMRIADISLKYQYNSPEVFSRAFARLWGTKPSAFRKQWRFSGLFPKIVDFDYIGDQERGIIMRRKVDISEVYDVLKELQGTYVLCFDIVGLVPINAISHELGDQAILETARRIEGTADENMLLFRIGGDEFALVTGLRDPEQVRVLAEAVLSANGEEIQHKGRACPLALRVGAMRMTNPNLKYCDLYAKLQGTIDKARADGLEFLIADA